MKVTCVPRVTVTAVGQMALLTMRKVLLSGRVEQVMPVDGPVPLDVLPPQAAVTAASAAAIPASNRIRVTASILPSEELARDVEAQIPVVLDRPAPGDLRHRRAERVREVQLEKVPAGALLDGEAR